MIDARGPTTTVRSETPKTVNDSLEQSEEVPLPQKRLIEALLTLQ
jgi:hypothetical protein